jgi:hypothetical protein
MKLPHRLSHLAFAALAASGIVLCISPLQAEESASIKNLDALSPTLVPLLKTSMGGIAKLGYQSFAKANLETYIIEVLQSNPFAVWNLGCTSEGICEYSNVHHAGRNKVLEGTVKCPNTEFGPCTPVELKD